MMAGVVRAEAGEPLNKAMKQGSAPLPLSTHVITS